MRNRVQLAGTALAMALLVVGLPAAAAAQTEGGPQVGAPSREYVPIPKIMLTGMLKSDGADGYLLVDQQSGDSIELKKKSKKLEKHEGTMVAVEGRWADNDPTSEGLQGLEGGACPRGGGRDSSGAQHRSSRARLAGTACGEVVGDPEVARGAGPRSTGGAGSRVAGVRSASTVGTTVRR